MLAVGRDFSDVSPVDGIIVGSRKQKLGGRGGCAAGRMTQAHPSSSDHDVIILGAGAAGLMCAAVAGQRGRSVLVLEQARHPGEKIRISGGGRCNFTNLHTSPANFLSSNPRFCRSALSGYTQRDFIALVENYGIAFHEKTRGQLFCDGSSRQIIDMLLEECRKAHAQLRLGVRISAVTKAKAALSSSPIRANFAAARWWSQPAARRFRKWDRAASATGSPSSSGLRSCRRARRWCR